MSKIFFEGIIITGTSCAGKSTIAKELCEPVNLNPFEVVFAVTTRPQRNDDYNYEYVNDTEFNSLLKNEELLTSTSYRDKRYGIKLDKYKDVLAKSKFPILILTPDSAMSLLNDFDGRFMCFFVDSTDEELINRLKTRENRQISDDEKKSLEKQFKIDRRHSYKSNYVLKNNNLAVSVSLIKQLWEQRGRGGGISYNMIKSMIECGMLLDRADVSNVQGASYDLLLGDEYYYAGKIKRLSDADPFLTIEPYDYTIVSCKELACLPRDIIAKFGLTVGLFCQGIILSNGPQVDPGFRGTLFCLLFNTSNRAVHLKRGKHYATIEFNKLIEPAKPYEGKYQGTENIIEYIPANALQGAINELKKEIEELKNESKYMQGIYMGVAALMFAIISILLVLR
ncbi:MAG: dCTP deaminase domain-containing protein [Deltaproteobacteria bacterium]